MKKYILCFFMLWGMSVANCAIASEPILKDYWEGKAEWKLNNSLLIKDSSQWQENVDKFINIYGYQAGTQIFVKNGVWYMVAREYDWENKTSKKCLDITNGQGASGSTIRRSYDQGKTWSWPQVIVPKAVAGSPWECSGTDGSMYFDRDKNQWLYLFQCLGSDGHWNGCLATRNNIDPYGDFELKTAPVIVGGELWRKICNSNADVCVQESGGIGKVADEGTFDIYDKIDGYYYISFHGFDGLAGFRGTARTKNFVDYETGDDSVLSKRDSRIWRELWQGENKGFGFARSWKEGDEYYLITESMDTSLLCMKDQNWDYGVVRSSDIWLRNLEQLPAGNPILYSSKRMDKKGETPACDLQYASIFQDDKIGKYYMHVSRDPNWEEMGGYTGIYIYELVFKKNLLTNGDFDRCDFSGWDRMQPVGSTTNYLVLRKPEESYDARCFLATNCGGECRPGQSIYQDVEIIPGKYTILKFGGIVSSLSNGQLTIKMWQFGDKGNVLDSSETTFFSSPEYKEITQDTKVNPLTVKLRIEFYLEKSTEYRLDGVFVEPIVDTSPGVSKFYYSDADLNKDMAVDLNDFTYWKQLYVINLLKIDDFLEWKEKYTAN